MLGLGELLLACVAVLALEGLDDKPGADRFGGDLDALGALDAIFFDDRVDGLDVGPEGALGDACGLEAEAALGDLLPAVGAGVAEGSFLAGEIADAGHWKAPDGGRTYDWANSKAGWREPGSVADCAAGSSFGGGEPALEGHEHGSGVVLACGTDEGVIDVDVGRLGDDESDETGDIFGFEDGAELLHEAGGPLIVVAGDFLEL